MPLGGFKSIFCKLIWKIIWLRKHSNQKEAARLGFDSEENTMWVKTKRNDHRGERVYVGGGKLGKKELGHLLKGKDGERRERTRPRETLRALQNTPPNI